MVTLENDTLKFTFPDISAQLRALIDEHVKMILPAFSTREARKDAVKNNTILESRIVWEPNSKPKKESFGTIRTMVEAFSPRNAEHFLRRYLYKISGLSGKFSAELTIQFQRTLRIPDNGRTYPLPAGLGNFPIRSVDDFSVPPEWLSRGGVMLPMYQSEALRIHFSSSYPFALQIGAGKVNAVSGEHWSPRLQRDPQDYVVIPNQPWLDGFSVGEGLIRQFVAMPIGEGYSVEEQLTGKAEFGGIQLQAFPMAAANYFHSKILPRSPSSLLDLCQRIQDLQWEKLDNQQSVVLCAPVFEPSMGLGAGGKMRQEIYEDLHPQDAWDQSQSRRCFVHLCNSQLWRQITGTNPPHTPFTVERYEFHRIPWFDYYRDDLPPLKGSKKLASVKSVTQIGKEKKIQPLPENESIAPKRIIQYGNTRRPREIREFLENP